MDTKSCVFDMIGDLLATPEATKTAPEPGDRGDRGENPRGCWAEAGATPGRQGATFGDRGAIDGEKSPPVAPMSPTDEPAPLLGKSPQSPLSPEVEGDSGRPSWRWLIQHADESWTDHTTTPHATLAEMRAAYPDAVSFAPLYHDARTWAQIDARDAA